MRNGAIRWISVFAQGYEKLSTFVEGSNNGQSSGTFSSKTQESDALLKEAVEVARTSDVALLVCGLTMIMYNRSRSTV